MCLCVTSGALRIGVASPGPARHWKGFGGLLTTAPTRNPKLYLVRARQWQWLGEARVEKVGEASLEICWTYGQLEGRKEVGLLGKMRQRPVFVTSK